MSLLTDERYDDDPPAPMPWWLLVLSFVIGGVIGLLVMRAIEAILASGR